MPPQRPLQATRIQLHQLHSLIPRARGHPLAVWRHRNGMHSLGMLAELHHTWQRRARFVEPLDHLTQILQRGFSRTPQARARRLLARELHERAAHVHGRLFEDGQVAPEAVVQLPELFQRGHRCARRCTRLLGVAELCEDVVHALGPGELDRECGEVEDPCSVLSKNLSEKRLHCDQGRHVCKDWRGRQLLNDPQQDRKEQAGTHDQYSGISKIT